MLVVHTHMNIWTIPGLGDPAQVAQQQRIAAMRPKERHTPQADEITLSAMSDQAREALRKVAQALRKAGGIAEPPPTRLDHQHRDKPGQTRPPAPPKNADGPSPASTDERRTTIGVAQSLLHGDDAIVLLPSARRRCILACTGCVRRVSMTVGTSGRWAAFIGAR